MFIREAEEKDVEAIVAIVIECDMTFTEFAPEEWQPPSIATELEHTRNGIASAERHVCVAELDDEVVGFSAWAAAAHTREPVDDPELAHLGRLFVRPDHWGNGVATALHAEALAAARAAGFSAMRLFTPSAHIRARRFYEREGWHEVGSRPESPIGLPITEYRRAL